MKRMYHRIGSFDEILKNVDVHWASLLKIAPMYDEVIPSILSNHMLIDDFRRGGFITPEAMETRVKYGIALGYAFFGVCVIEDLFKGNCALAAIEALAMISVEADDPNGIFDAQSSLLPSIVCRVAWAMSPTKPGEYALELTSRLRVDETFRNELLEKVIEELDGFELATIH